MSDFWPGMAHTSVTLLELELALCFANRLVAIIAGPMIGLAINAMLAIPEPGFIVPFESRLCAMLVRFWVSDPSEASPSSEDAFELVGTICVCDTTRACFCPPCTIITDGCPGIAAAIVAAAFVRAAFVACALA